MLFHRIKQEIQDEPVTKQVFHSDISLIKQESFLKTEISEIKEEVIDSKPEESCSNFFDASGSLCDDDDNEDDNKSYSVTFIKNKQKVLPCSASKLPNPYSSQPQKLPGINIASSLLTNASVFINPFEKEEQTKNKILEKHVRLTEAAPQKPANKPICWKFKKGKCHLGKNCRFFHDRDTLNSDDGTVAESNKRQSTGDREGFKRSTYHPAAYSDAMRNPLNAEPIDDDNYMASVKKKKRVGINDALMPPKKAYDSLMKMRQKERPWTMPSDAS